MFVFSKAIVLFLICNKNELYIFRFVTKKYEDDKETNFDHNDTLYMEVNVGNDENLDINTETVDDNSNIKKGKLDNRENR